MSTALTLEQVQKRRKTIKIVAISAGGLVVLVAGIVVIRKVMKNPLLNPLYIFNPDNQFEGSRDGNTTPSDVPATTVPTEDELMQIFSDLENIYGTEIAEKVERIFRLETRHFQSGGYMKTAGAGTAVIKPELNPSFPWGWGSLKTFWEKNPWAKPYGPVKLPNGWTYLKFPPQGGFYAVAEILKNRGGDVGRYFSNDATLQQQYRDKIANIATTYV